MPPSSSVASKRTCKFAATDHVPDYTVHSTPLLTSIVRTAAQTIARLNLNLEQNCQAMRCCQMLLFGQSAGGRITVGAEAVGSCCGRGCVSDNPAAQHSLLYAAWF